MMFKICFALLKDLRDPICDLGLQNLFLAELGFFSKITKWRCSPIVRFG